VQQVAAIYAGTTGLLDDVEVKDIRAFEDGLYGYLDASAGQVIADLEAKKALDDDIKKRLTDAIKDYKASFLASLQEKKEAVAR
jgi:F-type H+-transporting ATPase subunit alpha